MGYPPHIALYRKYFKIKHDKAYWHHLNHKPEIDKLLPNEQGGYSFIYKKKLAISTQPLTALQGQLTKKTIYLIGTGPSINQQALETLIDKKTILLNGSITLCHTHGLKPSYYMVADEGFIRRRMDFLDWLPTATPCIFSLGVIRNILNKKPQFFANHPVYLCRDATQPYDAPRLALSSLANDSDFYIEETIGFSDNINKGLIDGGTVMYLAAQLAIYMQCKAMVLAGFDLGNAHEPRFYETQQYSDKSGLNKAMDKIIASFTLLAKRCQQRQIELSNASPISSMPRDIIAYNPILEPC